MFNSYLRKISRISNYDIDRSLYLRLDANERTIAFTKKDISRLKKIIQSDILQSYPSAKSKLIKLISKKENLDHKYINIIPGADSGIKYFFDIYSGQKGDILALYPTYGMIDVYCKTHKFNYLKVNEGDYDYNNIINKINNKTLFVYIANPNSPSGKLLSEKKILQIIRRARTKNKFVLLDEAYIDFSKQISLTNWVKKYSNLVVLKTFSKCIGLAGLRIGYIVANTNANKIINSIRPPHDTSILSIKFAEYFLSDKKIWKNYLDKIKKSKKYIEQSCNVRAIKFINTDTNFFHIFFDKNKIFKIVKYFKKRKILVSSKYLGNYKAYKNSLRITYGSIGQMKVFFESFDKFLKSNNAK